EKSKVWTTGSTIEQLLKDHGISLKDDDKVKPGLDKIADAGKTVKIVRVEKDTDKVKESLAFETVKKKDSSIQKGEEKVISEGKEGTVVKKYEIIMENGEEVDRKLVDEEVTKESVNRVVAIGTKEPESNIVTLSDKKSNNNSNEPKSSGKVFYMTATGYTASCNGCSGITATGINLKKNPDAKVVA